MGGEAMLKVSLAVLALIGSAAASQAAVVTQPIVNGVPKTVSAQGDDFNLLNDHVFLTFSAVAGSLLEITAASASDPCIELYFGDASGLGFRNRRG